METETDRLLTVLTWAFVIGLMAVGTVAMILMIDSL